MDFFSSCNTKEDAKAVYRKLAKCMHPDKGGDEALMKELQDQYDKWHPRTQTYTGYQFNTINRNLYLIPFDHPIHEEMRTLRNNIAHLENELRNTHIRFAFANDSKNKEISELRKTSLQQTERIILLQDVIHNIQGQYNILKKQPWLILIQIIKEWWYAK